MARTEEDQLLADAIAGTEGEIFGEAVGKEAPSDEQLAGDRSVEEMGEGLEGQHEPQDASPGEADAAVDEADGKGAGDTDENRDPKTGQFKAAEKSEGEKPEGDKVEAKAADKPADDGKPKPRVPLNELLDERKGRQAAEAALVTEKTEREAERTRAQDEIKAINARLDALIANPQQRQQPTDPTKQPQTDAEKQPALIDQLLENPDAFVASLTNNITQQVTRRFVAGDLQRTHEAQGEKFEKAYAAITALDKNDPVARATVQRIWNSPTPGADLMKWHGRQEALRTVGDDPSKWMETQRETLRAELAKDPEFRKAVLETVQKEALTGGSDGKPRTTTKLPKSLNGAAGGSQEPARAGGGFSGDHSDAGVFADAFRQ